MALIFEQVLTDGITELSYLVGDDSKGVEAVFDPRADVECYLKLAREKQVTITHFFKTPIHADLVSGARELCARVQTAKIFLSHEGGARYGFDHEKIQDGDTFRLGSVLITVRRTPGHTPEHVAYTLAEPDRPEAPRGVPQQYGRNRRDLDLHAIDALKRSCAAHSCVNADLRDTVIAV